jgi:cobalt-zinc-cadmium efflux system outer membrane protein
VKHPLVVASLVSFLALPLARPAGAQSPPQQVSYDEALRAARRAAPDLVIARTREGVAAAEVGVAGVYPNPSVAVGTSTQTAKLSGTLSVPLVVLGQRGAAIDAAKAEQATVFIDTQVAWNDVRQATARAFVALWLAQGVAEARRESAAIQGGLESAVVTRVQVGSAPEIDSLRVHSEKLRADADVIGALAEVTATGTELGRWMGLVDGSPILARGEVASPDAPPSLATLTARIDGGAPVRRERSDVAAAEARADRERALVRPLMGLDLGFDAFDPTLCATPSAGCSPPVNYRAQLSIEIPIFNLRGPFIDREKALADVARARVQAAHIQQTSELTAAYRTFEAATARQKTLADAVVPAARAAAKSTEEAYTLGRAQLVAVLDAERSLVDVRVSALEAQAARANAWIDVEHALGAP